MTKSEIQNSEEHVFSSIEEMFNELSTELKIQIDKLDSHIAECVREIKIRENEGKRVTILQKNVLLNLLNQRTNIMKHNSELVKHAHLVNTFYHENLA